MKFDVDQSTIQLSRGNLISLPQASGSTVAVLWGFVWLTQDGHHRDYELRAGDSFTIRDDGMIVISAFENSALTILQPCEDVAISPTKLSENTDRTTVHRKANDTDGVRYISADELQQFKDDAHKLRAIYVASLIYSLGCALSRGFTNLRNFAAAAMRRSNGRREWTEPPHRLNW
jgi:Protein of unknown function (DUF2917)